MQSATPEQRQAPVGPVPILDDERALERQFRLFLRDRELVHTDFVLAPEPHDSCARQFCKYDCPTCKGVAILREACCGNLPLRILHGIAHPLAYGDRSVHLCSDLMVPKDCARYLPNLDPSDTVRFTPAARRLLCTRLCAATCELTAYAGSTPPDYTDFVCACARHGECVDGTQYERRAFERSCVEEWEERDADAAVDARVRYDDGLAVAARVRRTRMRCHRSDTCVARMRPRAGEAC